jgi:hypothetical protein
MIYEIQVKYGRNWTITEIGRDSSYRWDLFGPELREKMDEFCECLV